MDICSCGNVAEKDARCARCNALLALELNAGASVAEIQNAFEVLSKAWNADRFEDGSPMKAMAEEKRKAIEDAHSLLIRSSVQAAPFRSEAPGERYEAPIDTIPETKTGTQKTRKLGYNDDEAKPLRLPMPLMIGCGVVVAGVVVAWVLFKPLDATLMSIPVAGKTYASFKTSLRSGIQELKNKVGIGTGPAALPEPGPASPAANPSPAAEVANEAAPTAQRGAGPVQAVRTVVRVQPYITAGLTEAEVIAAQGNPTAQTAGELDYGSSKLYFTNDALSGWKVDTATPIRVKLWPDAVVDPDLRSFGVGSTKNDVIVVQGTPTFFSESTFGYGASEVHFKNNRVVSWKSDPSAPLRTSTR